MRRALKNNKGVTLMSVIIYITIMFVVLAAIMRITIYFSDNMREAADVSFETEFNKLNIYLLDEAKKTGNNISEINTDGTQIIFSKGNKYTYNSENKIIYLNDTIKVCENVESCLFEEEIAENGKNILALTIKINGTTKTMKYVVVSHNYENEQIIVQGDYIINKEHFKNLYQQVEYIGNDWTQYINTGFIPSSNTSIEMKVSNTSTTHACLYCARSDGHTNTYSAFLIDGTSLRVDYYDTTYSNIMEATKGTAYVYKQNKNMVYVNNELLKTIPQTEFSSEYNMYLMASHNQETGAHNIGKIKLYYCKIWDGETIVRNFIPCYRKADGVVGLYDTVNDVFYTNAGTGTFEKGAKVN